MLVVAAMLDVLAWGAPPFRSFDVLYLIGCSVPILVMASRAHAGQVLVIAGAVFLATPIASQWWGYDTTPAGILRPLHAALLGGWFPVLPWLGVGLIGTALGKRQSEHPEASSRATVLGAIALLVAGAALWSLTSPPLATRGGYAEYFYPPTLGVLAVFTGLALLALAGFTRQPRLSLSWLEALGRRSLVVYAAHILLIARVVAPLELAPGWSTLLLGFVFLAGASTLLVFGLDQLGPRPKSVLVRTILGG